ncbi:MULTISPECIES: hypothetical protein [Burkholderia]|uniref:hypothetical protein n=1 Tax=Burkholderia TaxID=32008 RepID=UPI0008419D75|nr:MULTISPECIES: hypothetical protein [unclassified Burkholderia]AOK28875.1 hypothetical protein AQ611_04965 [Burkholderia sp. Bp7605]
MLPLSSWATKAVAGVLLAAGLVVAALSYRAHVYSAGYADGQRTEQQKHASELAFARKTDQLISDKAEADLRAKLKEETDAHKARTSQLETALAAARADSVGLSQQLTRLHDAAVSGRPGPARDAPGAGATTAPAEASYTLADLMRNDEENYAICRKNSAQLEALQDWYERLRAGNSGSAE